VVTGRTQATQLFPDSSQGFIRGDLQNSYNYLAKSSTSSVTTFKDFGSPEERGGAWLFLRWLGDQKGESIYGRLDQTAKTGVANVEDKAGETFPSLFGDFSLAVFTDSLPGTPRASTPSRLRFKSRNLRQIYSVIGPQLGRASFPVTPRLLPANQKINGTLVQGTMAFWQLTTATGSNPFLLSFSKADATAFPKELGAQVGVFRLP